MAYLRDRECPICFDELAPKTGVVRLVCKHKFHDHCILQWLKKKPSCPFCNRKTTVRAVQGLIRRRSNRHNPMAARKQQAPPVAEPVQAVDTVPVPVVVASWFGMVIPGPVPLEVSESDQLQADQQVVQVDLTRDSV
uniref:Putative ring finger n=1 Tax=Culex tarsalis TaxID=7177 RepID=A0A1Q3FT49_CULTA